MPGQFVLLAILFKVLDIFSEKLFFSKQYLVVWVDENYFVYFNRDSYSRGRLEQITRDIQKWFVISGICYIHHASYNEFFPAPSL